MLAYGPFSLLLNLRIFYSVYKGRNVPAFCISFISSVGVCEVYSNVSMARSKRLHKLRGSVTALRSI